MESNPLQDPALPQKSYTLPPPFGHVRAVRLTIGPVEWANVCAYFTILGATHVDPNNTGSDVVLFVPSEPDPWFELRLHKLGPNETVKAVPYWGTNSNSNPPQPEFDAVKNWMAHLGNPKEPIRPEHHGPVALGYTIELGTYIISLPEKMHQLVDTEVGIINNPNYKP